MEKIEQVVRLIRSKGVGVYFVTQSPADIPDDVLGQLGNRVQHALRAFTPKDQKAVRVAAQTFRPNPNFETETAITNLGVGEALVSCLDAKGAPGIVQQTLICPPQSRMGPLLDNERAEKLSHSPLKGKYDTAVDNESAYEILKKRAEELAASEVEQDQETFDKEYASKTKSSSSGGRKRQGVFEAMAKSAARSIGSSIGRQIVRGLLGSIIGKR